MQLGIPKEIYPGERRVAATPDTVRKLVSMGFSVTVQAGAGEQASFPDAHYAAAGARVDEAAEAVWRDSDVILKVRAPMMSPSGKHEADLPKESATLISFLWPSQNEELLKRLAARKVNALAMDAVPRISRAQAMDALSSMANIAGYRAVVEAAGQFGSFFTQQITAAGKLPPARVLVIGAGVAGLAAVAAARALGAVVRAFDTRAAVKEQVKSLGAEFLELDFKESGEGAGGYAKEMSPEFVKAEMELFARQAKEVDILITTALVPGRPAPKLITTAMVESMKPGSVIVDLASEQGGNCEVTRPGSLHVHQGVHIIGYTDMPSRLATTASQLYGNNLVNLLQLMGGGGAYRIDTSDQVVRGALVVHQGVVTWPPPPLKAAPPPAAAPRTQTATEKHAADRLVASSPARSPARRSHIYEAVALLLITGWTYAMLTQKGPASADAHAFLQHATVFVLACFVGWQVIWNVSPALHTPLMSVTNAISGIIIIGGMLQAHGNALSLSSVLGTLASLLATLNIAGGFLVTQRMLRMFRK
jgi:NAD(P) transhydrogenase subunit alpha